MSLSRTLAAALGAGLFALGAAGSAQAVTFPVKNNNDSGGYSLRSAIKAANGASATNVTIDFEIPGSGVHTITPLTPLPVITRAMTIDGYTQKDAAEATATSSAVLKAVIDGRNVNDGLEIEADGVTVKGLNIQGAIEEGVHIEGDKNTVAGNFIGTTVDGASDAPNALEGVRVFRGDNNQIGGPNPEDRNVISSNGFGEVVVDDGTGNTVQGNYVGTDDTGTQDLGWKYGVVLSSTGNTVRDNVVSGEAYGVDLFAGDNVVQGNKIGTDPSGKSAVPNIVGVYALDSDGNQIGGTAEGQENVISGNTSDGVELKSTLGDGTVGSDVVGNLIGVTADGDALPNGGSGVLVSGSDANTIGGTAAGAGNVISANAGDGVKLDDADNNLVLGNLIGTDTAGDDLGNGGSGVEIAGGSNRVGDTAAGSANTIAFNGKDGVTVASGGRNAVLSNSIHSDHQLPIDLGADGGDGNDADDTDTGANGKQNAPEIDSTTATDVTWSLDSAQTTRYRIEFFANDACSVSRSSEARTFVKSIDVTTDVNGEINGRNTPLTLPAGAGPFVTMTATELNSAGEPLATSEVSPCMKLA